MKRIFLLFFIFLFWGCLATQQQIRDLRSEIDTLKSETVMEMAEGAGVKISNLTEKTDQLSEDDEIAVVDTSPTPTTKRIVPQHFFQADMEDKTSNYTVLPADGRKILTNNGAGAGIEFDLPECLASPGAGQVGPGWWVILYLLDAYAITVDPHANDTIGDFASGATEAGDNVVSDTSIGSCIKLICACGDDIGNETDAYNFYSMGYVGVWTAED